MTSATEARAAERAAARDGVEAVTAAASAGVRPLTQGEFEKFQRLIYERAGIWLGPGKTALLAGRLARRVRDLGLGTYSAYHRAVLESDAEAVWMLDAVTTNETYFFREPQHFTFIDERVLPAVRAEAAAGARPKRVRVWSAACSSGEEPYSLAMLLLDRFPPDEGWSVEVLATDLSTRVLARAEAGVYPADRAERVPRRYLEQFMLRGTGPEAGKVKVAPWLRAAVRFRRLNLHDPAYSLGPDPFDLILCRNALIYFDPASRAGVVDRLISHLAPGGHLVLGHSESLNAVTNRVRCVSPSVYAHAAAARGARPAPTDPDPSP